MIKVNLVINSIYNKIKLLVIKINFLTLGYYIEIKKSIKEILYNYNYNYISINLTHMSFLVGFLLNYYINNKLNNKFSKY